MRKNKPLVSKQLTIKSKTAYLKRVRDFVAREARAFGFHEDDVNKITLAVDEACTNIIRHAYQYADDYPIRLYLSSQNKSFQITIEDDGAPFDPDSIQLPNIEEHVKQYRSSGYGMYLMKSLMDKVEYKIKPGATNRVILTKYLKSKRK